MQKDVVIKRNDGADQASYAVEDSKKKIDEVKLYVSYNISSSEAASRILQTLFKRHTQFFTQVVILKMVMWVMQII